MYFEKVGLHSSEISRANSVLKIATSHKFDWIDIESISNKLREELDEVVDALNHKKQTDIFEEVGDLLFVVISLAQHLDVDPESALRFGIDKFERRFIAMAGLLTDDGSSLADHDREAMEAAWQVGKLSENK